MPRVIKVATFFATMIFVGFQAPAAESMYVQASKADLKNAPKMNAPSVKALRRGDKLTVLEKGSLWYRAQSTNVQGWISRLFLSTHQPVGEADLLKTLPESLEKVSRRRSSEYAVAASARGLTGERAEERAREGQNFYQANFEALEKMETYQVKQERLDNFRSSARISIE